MAQRMRDYERADQGRRHRDEGYDDDRRDMQQAYGRYSGSGQSDDRSDHERNQLEGAPYEDRRYGQRHRWHGPQRNVGSQRYDEDRDTEYRRGGYEGGSSYRPQESSTGYGQYSRGQGGYDSPYEGEYERRQWDQYGSGQGQRYGEARQGGLGGSGYGSSSGYGTGGLGSSGYTGQQDGRYAGGQYASGQYGSGQRTSDPYGSGQTYRGMGPKGYTRSDERIKEAVCDCLTDDPHIDARDIEVAVKEGEVTLSGNVGNRTAKRHAEELAEQLSGVSNVQNNLRVTAGSESQAGGSQFGTEHNKYGTTAAAPTRSPSGKTAT